MSLRDHLGRGAALGAALGVGWGVVECLANRLLEVKGDASLLLLYRLPAGVLVGLALGVAIWTSGRAAGGRTRFSTPSEAGRWFVLLAGTLFVVVLVVNDELLHRLPWRELDSRAWGFTGAGGVVMFVLFRRAWAGRTGDGPAAALLAASAVLLGLGWLGAPPHAGTWKLPPPSTRPAVVRPLALIAIDGLWWRLLDPLLREGRLPNLARLLPQGFVTELPTLYPTRSPMIWTTVATGATPERHGIDSFMIQRYRGMETAFAELDLLRSPFGRPLGLVGERLGLLEVTPVTSAARRSPALWQIFSAAGRRVAVINWWATWPAEPVRGWMVSDRVNYHRWLAQRGIQPPERDLTYPVELLAQLEPLLFDPMKVSPAIVQRFIDVDRATALTMRTSDYRLHRLDSEFKYLYAIDRTSADIAELALERGGPFDLFMVYLRGVDLISHCALQYSTRLGRTVPAEARRRYGRAVERYYIYTDELVGRMLARLPPETLVMLLSDHGFEPHPDIYAHHRQPPGVLMMSGPDLKAGARPDQPTLFDLAPTILWASGLPVGDQMPGRVLRELFSDAALERLGPVRAASYTGARRSRARASSADHEIRQRLRAVGYVN